jgi:predicted Fe-Mo cluster-binding NifX family protein
MKIAVSATGPSLDAEVDPRFGRCQYFIIVDPQTMQFEAIENTSAMASGGAGISAAQMIAGKGVEAVLTGNCGPNAYQVLSPAGIKVITGVSGKVQDAIQGYKAGKLQPNSQPNVADHFGMGGGMGMGRGMGMGKGMGRGRGMGRGGGMGGWVMPPPQTPAQNQDIEELKAQSKMLVQQLSEIAKRLERLEKKGR